MAPRPEAVPDVVEEQGQARVERTLLRDTFAGMLIGAVICAGIWCLLVFIALQGLHWVDKTPMLFVGLGCGVFAGIFLGGWAGALIGASKLEHYEHAILPRA